MRAQPGGVLLKRPSRRRQQDATGAPLTEPEEAHPQEDATRSKKRPVSRWKLPGRRPSIERRFENWGGTAPRGDA